MPTAMIGIVLSLCAVFCGVITGAIVKGLADSLPLLTVLFYRFLFSLPILFGVAVFQRGRLFLQVNQKRVLAIRILFGMSGIVLWFLSVRTIPLGLATALFQSSALFLTMLSPVLLAEPVGRYRTGAVIVGLMGIVIITEALVQPLSAGIVFAILAAFCGAGLSIALRKLGKADAPATVASLYNGTGFIIISLCLLVFPHQLVWLTSDQLISLILLGGVASLLQICMTSAYRYSEAVVVSSLRYMQVPAAGIAGYLIFDEIPSTMQLWGAVIVIGSCIFIVWREFILSRKPQSG